MDKFELPISPRIQALKERRKRQNKDLRLNFERNRIITDYYKANPKQYPIMKRLPLGNRNARSSPLYFA